MIEIISPAGFESFVRDIVDLTGDGPPDMAAMGALADVVGRYGLRHPETG